MVGLLLGPRSLSEGGDNCPVKPAHTVFNGNKSFFQGSVETLAAVRPGVLFMVHVKDSAFTTGTGGNYTKLRTLPLPLQYR